jgi:hypothetical protein
MRASAIVLGVLAMASGAVAGERSPSADARRPRVVLAHDGGGDFGPNTPGTSTAGWQEALAACVARHRDLYVQGGWGGEKPIYHVRDTIRIPASQDFRIDGGIYVLNWIGPADKDLLVVDSGMDCHYSLGNLVYGGRKAALRVKPESPVPIDKVAVFIDSDVSASSIADPQPFKRGRREAGAGVVFDTSKAAIVHATFHFTAVLNFATCIDVPSPGQAFAHNELSCGHLHTNADGGTLLKLAEPASQNTVKVRIGVDQGATEVTGIALAGNNNVLEVNTRGGFASQRTAVLQEPAQGNQLNVLCGGSDVGDLVTDKAAQATNQLTWTGPPAPIRRVKVPSSDFTYVQRLFPATVRLEGGSMTQVTLHRGKEAVDCGDAREALLSVGDRLRIESGSPPTLVVVPLKVR